MVDKRTYLFCIFLILGCSLISLTGASIIISQPDALYSLGDNLNFEIKLDSIKTGYLDINLVCSNSVENIYHDVPSSISLSITRTLIPAYVESSNGVCHLVANYAEESALSQNFQINSVIDVVVSTDNLQYKAGEYIRIKGTAYKSNNQLVGQIYKAYAEVIMNDEIKVKGEVKDSQFDMNFKTPETTKKGTYLLTIIVTEEDSQGNVLNNGQKTAEVKITQQTARIDIAMDKQSINPGESITLIPSAYDVAGDLEEGKLSLRIEDALGSLVYEGIVESNKNVVLTTKTTNLPGTSKVIAKKDAITAERFFQINEHKKVSAQIVNGSLVITNIGNIPYNGIVEITIGGQVFAKEVVMGLGESKVYGLSAPDGVYDIGVSDGSELLSQQGVSLTGRAISVNAKTALSNIFTNYPIVWIFLAIVIALFIWVYYKKYYENRKFGFAPFGGNGVRISSAEKKRGGVEVIRPETIMRKTDEAISEGDIRRAEQVSVLHGQKQIASVIALKIKNSVQGILKNSINSALERAYKNKAVSYNSGDYIILIFSPLITGSSHNEEIAIKTAIEMDNVLKEHNRKFRNDTIKYGIGVNSGEIINKMAGKILQFTNISNTFVLAKRVAESADSDLLLSKQIHEKTMNNIKAEKATAGSLEAFSIKRVVDKEKSEKFIQGFLRRNSVK